MTLCLRSRHRFDFWPRLAHSAMLQLQHASTLQPPIQCHVAQAPEGNPFSKLHDVLRLGLGHADLPGHIIALFQTFLVPYLKRL